MKDGGPAFPMCQLDQGDSGNLLCVGLQEGMSLRDWFAGMALMSMLCPVQDLTDTTPTKAARLSYKMADAMLAERNKEPL